MVVKIEDLEDLREWRNQQMLKIDADSILSRDMRRDFQLHIDKVSQTYGKINDILTTLRNKKIFLNELIYLGMIKEFLENLAKFDGYLDEFDDNFSFADKINFKLKFQ